MKTQQVSQTFSSKGLGSHVPRFSSIGIKSTSSIAIIKCHSFLEMALHTDQNGKMIFDKSCFFQVENLLLRFSSKQHIVHSTELSLVIFSMFSLMHMHFQHAMASYDIGKTFFLHFGTCRLLILLIMVCKKLVKSRQSRAIFTRYLLFHCCVYDWLLHM